MLLPGLRLWRQHGSHLARCAPRLARGGEHGDSPVRDLPLYEILRLVVGDHAQVSLLPGAGACLGAPDPGAAPPAGQGLWRSWRARAMIAWTRRRTLIAGAKLIVLTNAVALGGVAWNRSAAESSLH